MESTSGFMVRVQYFPWVHECFMTITLAAEFLWHLLALWLLSATPSDQCWWTMKGCLWDASSPVWMRKRPVRGSKSSWQAGLVLQCTVAMPWSVRGTGGVSCVPQLAISSWHVNKEKTMYVILQGFFQQILIPDTLLFSHNVYSKQLSLAS